MVGKTIRLEEIKEDAGAAAAGAYKAIVGIPIIGPALAPIAAATAYAGVLAFDSAEGGYDISPRVNPMVQLHRNEMVLPQEHANTIRMLSEIYGSGAGAAAGAGRQVVINQHVSSPDSAAAARFLMDNRGGIAKALKRHLGR